MFSDYYDVIILKYAHRYGYTIYSQYCKYDFFEIICSECKKKYCNKKN
jgi:hypothetical protein